MGAFESGQSFMAGVLAKLPESQREAARALFESAEARDAVTLIGDGALARSDYSRNMDGLRAKEQELNAHYERLNDWYATNKSALEEARELKANGGGMIDRAGSNGHGDPNPNPDPANVVKGGAMLTADEVRKLAGEAIDAAGREYLTVTAFLSQRGLEHLHTFGEPLDTVALVNNPKLGRPIAGQPGRVFSLDDAYQEQYGEKVAAKRKEYEDKRFNEEVEKRLADRLRSSASQPFPLRSESSPLDVLTTKDGPAAHTLDTAVAEYERLQAARGA